MNKWKSILIEDFGKVITGKTPSSSKPAHFGKDYPFITPSDISETQKFVTSERFLSESGMQSHKRIFLPKRSVCVVCIGATIGKVCMTYMPCISNQQINSLITDRKKHDPEFVYYLCSTLKETLINFAGGAATPIVNKSAFSSIKVLVPELEIQQKIAATLSAYDDLIENNKRRISLLEKMAEEIYREWFVRFRFPGHEKVKFEKGMPSGWKTASLGKIADFTMGQSPKSEYYNQNGEGLPFNQGVGTYGIRFPQKTTFCTTSGRKAQKGDILFSVRAPVGRLNIADCEMIIGRGLASIRHKENLNSYLFYLLKSTFVNEDIIGNGAIYNAVGKEELKNFKILYPEKKLVQRFNDVTNEIDQQIYLLIKSNENLSSTRDLLLPRLISGKLSVEDLDIQFPPSMEEEVHEA